MWLNSCPANPDAYRYLHIHIDCHADSYRHHHSFANPYTNPHQHAHANSYTLPHIDPNPQWLLYV
jgi:hypothetical protein